MKPARPWHPYALLAPTVLFFGLFFLLPLALALYRSFFSWDLLTEPRYVGGANYRVLFESGELAQGLARTLRYSAVVVTLSMALGLGLAVVLDRPGRIYAVVRGAVFSSYVISWVAVALLWLWILDADNGVLSRTLAGLELPTADWLGDPDLVLYALAAVSVWKIGGYAMVLFLAGLQDVPRCLVEAAALDGAGPWRRFGYVTWPLLRPTAAFVGTTSLILSFQAFDIVRVMTQGGPIRATTVLVYAIYEQVFVNLRVGRANALAMVFFVLLLALTAVQLWAWRLASRARFGGQP